MLIIFFTSAFVIIDIGVEMTNAEIRHYMWLHNVAQRRVAKIKQKSDRTQVKKHLSAYQNRGYAFAQEKGNDVLLMEKLESKIGTALLAQILQKQKELKEQEELKAAEESEQATPGASPMGRAGQFNEPMVDEV